ncbi:hypothetical protein [Rhizosphaericola mali]|uniref:Uncharacterized protein n=1 Tax=Rhizosphaericola mali TaxID=2545455 RepID=A0A5P2G0K1_9BACT|nr:hypothetical protein [Rhizosphaericola mali]QES88707.1 hypothetical protein E0W69_008595 [Rhizosphaericola mali]
MEETLKDLKDEELVSFGTMDKSPSNMSEKEYEEWKIKSKDFVREYLFSINQPLVYEKDGVMVAEYKDGRIEKV